MDLGSNAERTGVPADPRTRQRLHTLLEKLDSGYSLLDRLGKEADNDYVRNQVRSLQGSLGATRDEALRVAERLHLGTGHSDTATH